VKTASQHKTLGGYQYKACVWIFSTEILVSLQPKTRTVTWGSQDPMAGSPKI